MADKARKCTYRITYAGWALLPAGILLTLGAINSGLNVTYLLACLAMTVFAVGIVAPLWSGRGVDCRREIREMPYAGEPFDYTLVITSQRRSAARRVRILDPLGGPKSKGKLVMRLPPKGTVRIPCAPTSRASPDSSRRSSVRCANTIPATACAACTGASRRTAANCTCARSSASASRRR
jgi:hypothetical protein